jgi:2-polyprenyl-3-methyl-5-hydroxy-6-metoxy-1,4-benzoquinol methylase
MAYAPVLEEKAALQTFTEQQGAVLDQPVPARKFVMKTEPATACRLCNRQSEVLYSGVTDRNLFIPGKWSCRYCDDCDIAWLDPQPAPEDVALAYEGSYYTRGTSLPPVSLGRNPIVRALRGMVLSARYGYSPLRPQIPLADALGWAASLIPGVHKRATLGWLKAIPPYRPNGRVLEIGCGDGMFLLPLRELGWEIHAIEPDPAAAEKAARNAGARIWPGSVETAQVPESTFDAVVSMHAIEHVFDPRTFIERAANFLRPGGFLYITTPNFQSLARRTYGRDWHALDAPRHLNMLTPKSLESICRSTKMLRVQSIRTLTRRARREWEHVHAVRETGDFFGDSKPSLPQRVGRESFNLLEKAGSQFLKWGEEIELVAYKGDERKI